MGQGELARHANGGKTPAAAEEMPQSPRHWHTRGWGYTILLQTQSNEAWPGPHAAGAAGNRWRDTISFTCGERERIAFVELSPFAKGGAVIAS